MSYKIRVEEMKVLANARKAILSEMEKVITSCYKPAEDMITSIIKVESGFINIENPKFLAGRSKCMSKFFQIF